MGGASASLWRGQLSPWQPAVVQRGELNELQRKSPEDLWKEDLAVFVEELEVGPGTLTS